MYFLAAALFTGTVFAASIGPRILYTPVFPFFPNLKQHHVIVIPRSYNSAYAFDFTPVDQELIQTKLDLFLGKNVPGEIRIIRISDATGDLEMIESWETMKGTSRDSKINDGKILRLIKRTKSWNTDMNMYTHNCQHFTAFMQGLLS